MTKGDYVCPFDHRSCHECVLYRGRHYYIDNCREGRGNNHDRSDYRTPAGLHHSADLQSYFQTLESQVEPWTDVEPLPESELKISLRLINVESGESSECSLEEVKQWDWNDSDTVRQIDGIQIDSWEKLVKVLSYKVATGHREVKIYEAPRFMVLAGG
jgi:hypothetical protein